MAIAVAGSGYYIGTDVTSATTSITCSGSNRLLYVFLGLRNPALGASTVTFNAVGLTKIDTQASSVSAVEMWELIVPDSTTANLVVTLSGTNKVIVGWIALTGVHQTVPRGTIAKANSISSATSLSVNVTSAINDLVLASLGWKRNGTVAVQAGMTALWNQQSGADSTHIVGAGASAPGAASVTMGWNFSGGQIGSIIAVPIKPITTSVSPAGVTIVNGELSIVTPDQQAGYGGIWSQAAKDATSSYFFAQLVAAGTQGATREASLEIREDDGSQGDPNNKAAIRVLNSNLEARQVVASTPTTLATTAYVAATHRFLRIREASGTTYWEHSTNGTTWNTLHSAANPITMSAVRLLLLAGHSSSVATTTVTWDNVNAIAQSPPPGDPVSDEGTLLGVS